MPVLQGVSGITAMVLREGLPIKEFDHPWELQSPMTPTKIVKAIPGNLRPESVLIIVSNEYDFSEGLPHYLSFAVYIDGLCIKRCVCKPSDVVAGKWEQVLTYGWYNIGSRNFRVLDEEFDLGPSDRRFTNDETFARYEIPHPKSPTRGTIEVHVHRCIDELASNPYLEKAYIITNEGPIDYFQHNASFHMYPGDSLDRPMARFKFVFKTQDALNADGINLLEEIPDQDQKMVTKTAPIDVYNSGWPKWKPESQELDENEKPEDDQVDATPDEQADDQVDGNSDDKTNDKDDEDPEDIHDSKPSSGAKDHDSDSDEQSAYQDSPSEEDSTDFDSSDESDEDDGDMREGEDNDNHPDFDDEFWQDGYVSNHTETEDELSSEEEGLEGQDMDEVQAKLRALASHNEPTRKKRSLESNDEATCKKQRRS
ncbi:hypothetical protein E8E14_000580 [Neopestalotiopsis sp. 37M]|nr:hypothetical protein E8E14_000580 [Neopestalotiopsis sp. 37M]